MYPYLEISQGYGRKRRSITVFRTFSTSTILDSSGASSVFGTLGAVEQHDEGGSINSFILNGQNSSSTVCIPCPNPHTTGSNGGNNGNGGSSGGNNGNGETDGQDGNGNSNGNGTNGSGSFGNSGNGGNGNGNGGNNGNGNTGRGIETTSFNPQDGNNGNGNESGSFESGNGNGLSSKEGSSEEQSPKKAVTGTLKSLLTVMGI